MLLVFCAFIVLILIGMPVAFSIGISGTLFFLLHLELPFTIPVQLAISQTQNFALLAVPLFILSGNFMNMTGITERLLRLSTVLTGHMRGGLAQVSIALATLMGGVSGSCIADAAMQTRILGPEMLKRGFSKGYTAGILSYGSLMTPIIPPGIGFILYGTVGQVSIGRLFAGGILPGLLLWLSLAITVSMTAKKRGYKPERQKIARPREIVSSTFSSIWAVLFPVMLLVGLRFGLFTPSEIGSFAVMYSIAIGIFAYKELKWKTFKVALEGSTLDIGAVMFLIALSGIFGYSIVWDRIPELISNLLLGASTNPYIVMIMIVIFLLIAGCFVDGSVLIIMLTPIFLPIATELGFDPVHFGLVFIVTITIGNFTPPVGSAMYAVCSILDCPIPEYTRESIHFFMTVSLVCILLIFFPFLSLFIPNLMFGK